MKKNILYFAGLLLSILSLNCFAGSEYSEDMAIIDKWYVELSKSEANRVNPVFLTSCIYKDAYGNKTERYFYPVEPPTAGIGHKMYLINHIPNVCMDIWEARVGGRVYFIEFHDKHQWKIKAGDSGELQILHGTLYFWIR